MIAFEQCHSRGFLWKAMGMCNNAKDALSECLRAERMKHLKTNQTDTKEKQERIRRAWKEIDENS